MTGAEKNFWIVLVFSLVVVPGALLCDVLFIPVQVLTDFHGQPALSPLYAFWIPVLSSRILRPVLASVGYVSWVWLTRQRAIENPTSPWLMLAHLVWFVILAETVAAIRLYLVDLGGSMRVYPGEEFWDDVPKVKDPGWFLSHFTSLQARRQLSLHGLAHPPGHTIFLWVVTQVFGRSTQAAALSILVVGCTGLVPVCLLARRIFGDRVASRVLALFPVVPSITMYAVSATDFLFFALAAWSLWLAAEAVLGPGAPGLIAVCAGLLGGVAATFSFAEGFVGLIIGLFAFSLWVDRPDTAVPRQVAWMAVGLASWYLLLRWGFGYDWIESLTETHRFHRYVIASEIGRLTPGLWLYTSLGNLLAFAFYLGIPVVAGAGLCMSAVFRARIWGGAVDSQFIRAVGITLGLMIFGGLFLLEVERIWLFMVGPLVMAACSAMPDFGSADGERREGLWTAAMCGILCAQSILYESLFFTIW